LWVFPLFTHRAKDIMKKDRLAASKNFRPPDASALSLELLISNLPGAVYRCLNDAAWTMQFVSAGIEKLTGYPAAAFTSRSSLTFVSIIHQDDREEVARRIEQALLEGRPFQLTYRIRCADGTLKWAWEQGAAVMEQGKVTALEGFIADFTRIRQAAALVVEQASLLNKAREAIFVIDMSSRITYWNKGAERLYGWGAADVTGQRVPELLCDTRAYEAAYNNTLVEGEWNGEMAQRRRDGTQVDTETRWTLLQPDDASVAAQKIFVISNDISERKHNEAKIFRLAFFDALTDLPNRASLLDHLRRALLSSARSHKVGALLFCDLDNFKTLNDSQGHAAGDELLQAVARRLERSVRETDLVARLGGDEFVILIQPLEGTRGAAAAQAETVAAKIVAAMRTPFQLDDLLYPLSVSVGVTVFSGVSDTVETALKQADAAMYQAKSAGRNTFRFFDPDMQAAWSARAELERALQRALRNNEFVLYYQPQLDRSRQVIGAEALLRWRLPSGKLVFPAEFIKAAEETDLIVDIGKWVLSTACTQLAKWQASADTAQLSLSVNVSPRQFVETDFVSMAQAILRQSGVDPRGLKLELTESLMVKDFSHTAQKMESLKSLGISFSLDDFGTGYSSLASLRKLPIDQLKIDHSFMRDVLTDHNDASIVRSIIALGDSLGLQVIAEGVETQGQRQWLSDAGCFIYQGFLYEHAIPDDHFARYARRQQRARN
jgi:diguanylate cyclase (GGDEF)-like protein/PAS domain S-box-containing protein